MSQGVLLKYGHLRFVIFRCIALSCTNLRNACKVVCCIFQPCCFLSFVSSVCLMWFVKLSKELYIRNKRPYFSQNCSTGSQVCLVVPYLKIDTFYKHSKFQTTTRTTWIISSRSLGDTDIPQISSPVARASSNCSPMAASKSSFQTLV